MNKKRKGVALDPLTYGVHEDAKTKFKHQSLMQDYQQLYKEVEVTRNKLKNTKQRKLALLAEVRFLRRRYQHLLKNKSPNPPQERRLVQPPRIETKLKSNTKSRRIPNKNEATLNHLPQISNRNPKVGDYMRKEAAPQVSNRNPMFDLNQKGTLHSVKETALHNSIPILDLNHKDRMNRGRKEVALRNPVQILYNPNERLYSGSGATLRDSSLVFDLNDKEHALSGRGARLQSRAPIIDLNQISGEDDEFEDNRESTMFEGSKLRLTRGEIDEPVNDVKLSICRNVGDDGPSSSGKRKISWQDQVALRV